MIHLGITRPQFAGAIVELFEANILKGVEIIANHDRKLGAQDRFGGPQQGCAVLVLLASLVTLGKRECWNAGQHGLQCGIDRMRGDAICNRRGTAGKRP